MNDIWNQLERLLRTEVDVEHWWATSASSRGVTGVNK